ncbi:hypothetical protein DL770_003653 [Monosporascus sp. CRB-9-2]|nr:hypothetical protein DL770_003653 [Monosporascus sp. CRB-9-2]
MAINDTVHDHEHLADANLLSWNGTAPTPTPQDLAQIWEWNSNLPPPVEKSVYEMIAFRGRAQPNAPAICAWDGELTYGQLNQHVSKLAARLFDFGIGPGVLVPLFFEKSKWTTVTILGVIKTGGGFVLLDPALPEPRLQAIVQQLKSSLLLCSPSHQVMGSRLVPKTVTISSSFFANIEGQIDPPIYEPCLSSIIYAVFTSGSTGTPKGVLITHRNAASALYYQVELLGLTAESRLFDFASYSFDGSINNAFTVLAAGGCLCVPSDEDRKNNLEQSILSLRANVLDLTPSVAKLLVPDRIPYVHLIIFAGEALHITEAKRWWPKVRVHNAYGPSECTATSTINCSASSPEEAIRIGKGAGLVTWIADPENHEQLLPLGYDGELLLEGPLVGHGYLNDPATTAAAFVENPAWLLRGASGQPGRSGRVYKTGDLVRYNEDGSLTYVSRKDAQVKIRGQRVELGEIEHILRGHDRVDDAIVMLQYDDRQEPWIASFATVRKDDGTFEEQPGNGEVQHVEIWGNHFDTEAYSPLESLQLNTVGRDFVGWTSMYDGKEIHTGDMNEWLDDTIVTILNGEPPGDVLEIGTGSGMILFNLTQGLRSYVGLEPSKRAVDFVSKATETIPLLSDKVKVHKATAADLDRLDGSVSPNLVILNSVIQYFPSQGYLFNVLQRLLNFKSVKTIFIGDIRSYALHKQFLATKALRVAEENPSKDKVERIMAEMEKFESELLIDPAFFTSLQSRLPDTIEHVEILPKKMHASNELSCYRYAAVIHASPPGTQLQPQSHGVGKDDWIDFVKQRLDRQSLSVLLQLPSASTIVAVSNIPYSKTIFERHVVDALGRRGHESQNDSNWLSSVRKDAQRCPSLSAIDLVELAQQAGYRVEISWARQHTQLGGLDAIFHRQAPANSKQRTMFRFPADYQGRPYHLLSNQPMRQRLRQQTQEELHEMLQAKLPSYMIPQMVVVLDEMPLNKNGKIDRQALAKSVQRRTAGREPVPQPSSEVERHMQKIWENVLNIDPNTVRLDDSFFSLGGNSIAAMKVVGEARRTGLELTVADVVSHPKLQDIARLARTPQLN